jgi:hypothetical protein
MPPDVPQTQKTPHPHKSKKQFDENFTKPLLNTYNPITYKPQNHLSESSHNPVRILVAAGRQFCPSSAKGLAPPALCPGTRKVLTQINEHTQKEKSLPEI